MQAQLANGGRPPASFGLNRSGASRPAERGGQAAKALDAIEGMG